MVKGAMQYACGRLHGQAWAGRPCHMHQSRGNNPMQHGDAMRRTRRAAQVQELAQEAAHCWPGTRVVLQPVQLLEHRVGDEQAHLHVGAAKRQLYRDTNTSTHSVALPPPASRTAHLLLRRQCTTESPCLGQPLQQVQSEEGGDCHALRRPQHGQQCRGVREQQQRARAATTSSGGGLRSTRSSRGGWAG